MRLSPKGLGTFCFHWIKRVELAYVQKSGTCTLQHQNSSSQSAGASMSELSASTGLQGYKLE